MNIAGLLYIIGYIHFGKSGVIYMILVVYFLLMICSLKASLLSAIVVINGADEFDKISVGTKYVQDTTKIEISRAINNTDSRNTLQSFIDARVITNAALRYFDEEVRLYKLKPQTRKEVELIFEHYLVSHPLLKIEHNNEIIFQIDDKKAFSLMINDITHTLLNGMSPFVRKIAIAFVFGGGDKLQYQLDHLDESVWNMRSKQYKDVVLDYLCGIIKRAVEDVDGKMIIKNYYKDVNKYFPNSYSQEIFQELCDSGQSELDIKQFRYL